MTTTAIPIDYLRACLELDPTGVGLRWRRRPEHHFKSRGAAKSWNSRWAGTPALAARRSEGYRGGVMQYEGKVVMVLRGRATWALLNGQWPQTVDHCNGDKADDRPENLRAASFSQNAANKPGKAGRGLPKGAYRRPNGTYWASAAGPDGKTRNLGTYATPEEAHAAFCAFASQRHGDFFNAG